MNEYIDRELRLLFVSVLFTAYVSYLAMDTGHVLFFLGGFILGIPLGLYVATEKIKNIKEKMHKKEITLTGEQKRKSSLRVIKVIFYSFLVYLVVFIIYVVLSGQYLKEMLELFYPFALALSGFPAGMMFGSSLILLLWIHFGKLNRSESENIQ